MAKLERRMRRVDELQPKLLIGPDGSRDGQPAPGSASIVGGEYSAGPKRSRQ